jgi:hypothetical protein
VSGDPGADADEVGELALRLRRRLLELDADIAPAPGAAAPEGAKAGEIAAVGALLVGFAQCVGGVGSIVTAVRSWVGGHPERAVELELDGDKIKITGATSEQQERLVAAWLERHEQVGATDER